MFENIPKNWKKDKLKNYIDIIRGVNYNSNEAYDVVTPDTTTLLRANNISSNGTINFDKVIYVSNKNIKDEQIIKKNDILVAMSSGSKDLVGKAAQSSSDLNCSFGAFCSIVRPKIINSKFIGYYFQTDFYRTKISELSTGININNLRKEYIENLDIAIPSTLEEQQEIVDVLDAASEIIRLRTACIESAQSLIPALFQEMFGDINNNIHSLPISEIKSCVEINPTKIVMNDNDDVTFLGMKDVTENGQIDLSTIKKYEEVKKGFTSFKNGDVLLAKITPCFENGKAAIAKNLVNNTGFGSTEFYVLRPNQNKILPEYLYSIVKSSRFSEIGRSNMKGAAGQKRLIKDFVSNYKFLLPDILQQKLYAAKVQEIEAYIKTQHEELENAKTMFQSLLHHSFTGELTRRAYGE